MNNFKVFVILLSVSLIVSSSAGTTKENKKKLLDKLRAALNSSDFETPVVSDSTIVELEKAEELEKAGEEEHSVFQDEIGGETQITDIKVEDSTELVANTFAVRFRNVIKRVLEVLGLRRRKDGRQSRLMAFEENELDHVPVYRDEVRTTVGAVLGQKECIQKVACVSGTYLKEIKGKQLIFALLDVFSPTSWKETVRIAKQSAIFNENCDYKCLE